MKVKVIFYVGLVPNICQNLFVQISERKQQGVQYKVTFSMLEIYNEEVRDLLHVQKGKVKQTLKIRERGDRGFYGKL